MGIRASCRRRASGSAGSEPKGRSRAGAICTARGPSAASPVPSDAASSPTCESKPSTGAADPSIYRERNRPRSVTATRRPSAALRSARASSRACAGSACPATSDNRASSTLLPETGSVEPTRPARMDRSIPGDGLNEQYEPGTRCNAPQGKLLGKPGTCVVGEGRDPCSDGRECKEGLLCGTGRKCVKSAEGQQCSSDFWCPEGMCCSKKSRRCTKGPVPPADRLPDVRRRRACRWTTDCGEGIPCRNGCVSRARSGGGAT